MNRFEHDGTMKRCLVMMTKYPAPGQVKTRLAAGIGAAHAAELSKRFILDLLQTLASRDWEIRIALHPWERNEEMSAVVGEKYELVPQRGCDLGERMGHVFLELFSEAFQEIIMIGSDAPDLPAEFIEEAFTALANHDAVLGPACDGGYYLIGFRRGIFSPLLLDSLPWGAPDIFVQQLKRLREQKLQVYILPPWHDIDTQTDLKKTAGLAGTTPFAESLTMAYIGTMGLRDMKGNHA
ncbi:MAG TPA: TIGR04282 family arsenosugar biosynthesis glycosyltransferase [Syntrophales bacterium]|nr:TIGR04282 family arsenosugar biosynthesis glycosyltransferase [Syntrophales bacterium]